MATATVDRTHAEWKENERVVSRNPEAATNEQLYAAIGYLRYDRHRRKLMGESADTIERIEERIRFYVAIYNTRTGS